MIMLKVSNFQREMMESYIYYITPVASNDWYNLNCFAGIENYSPHSFFISFHQKKRNPSAGSLKNKILYLCYFINK